MGVKERFNAKQKDKKEENENNALGGVRKRFEEKQAKFNLESAIGFDTFESDLNTIGSTVFDAYNGWQTSETMQNTKASAQKLYDRIGAYEEYRTKYGNDTLPDLSELLGTYKTALEGWDDRTTLYGHYQNAEAFDKAVKNYQLSEKFKGLSYDDVQARMRRYSPDSDEYNYLKNYTEYSSAEDFDKAISAAEKDYEILYGDVEDKIADIEEHMYIPAFADDTPSGRHQARLNTKKTKLEENGKHINHIDELNKAKNVYEIENGAVDDYKHLEQNEDFAEHSQYDPSVNEGKNLTEMNLWTGNDGGYDRLYGYINNAEGVRDWVSMTAAMAGSSNGYADEGYDLLYDNEVAYYNYLKHWDRQNGTKEADKFLKDMKPALQKRVSDRRAENREVMLDNPFMATAFSLTSPIATLAGGMGNLMATAGDIISGDEYNPYEPLREISNANTHGRQVVSQNIAEATDGIELFGQNIPSFLYNTGMSVLDTTVGGASVGAGYTLLMGTNAYQQKAKELTEAGYDDATVQGLAIVSGALEAAFEYAGFEHLIGLKDADSIGKMIYNALVSQGAVEGLEEFGTSLGTIIAEAGFLGEDSQYMKMYSDLIERGFSTQEANTEVAKAIASELGWSYIGGHLSGTGLGAGVSYGQYKGNVSAGKDIRSAEQTGNVFDIASMTPEESEAYQLYTQYANKGVNKDNATNAQIGNLYNTLSSELHSEISSTKGEIDKAKKTMVKYETARRKANTDSPNSRIMQKLDGAITQYTDAQERLGKYSERFNKLGNVEKSVFETKVKKTIEENEAREKAKHEAEVKKLSSGVETSVISKTGETLEIKGIKDRNTLITNEGEVAFKDAKLSEKDARLLSYARGMASDEASLYYEQYDGKADVEQYTNDFNLAVEYAKHSGFTEKYILEHTGSLSGEQVAAIYKNTVIAEARLREEEHNKLIATTANNTPYTGYIDDSVIKKIGWNKLNQRQRTSVEFLKVFAAKSGMNLVFTPYSKTSNGAFDIKDNTIYVSVYAGILFEKNKLRDTIIPTASHEITHWMEEKAPELWDKLKNVALDALVVAYKAETGKDITQADIIAKEVARLDKKHSNKKHTDKDAVKELVAKACEDMLSMSKEGRKMFESMTEAEQKTFIGKVKEIVANLMEWIDEFLSSYGAQSKEAKLLRNYKDKLQEMSEIWDQMLVRSIEVNQAMEKADVFGHLENGISTDGTTIVGENNLQMSDKTYSEGGRDFLVNWLDGQEDLSEEDKQDIVEQTDRVAEIMRAIDKGGEIPEYSRWANLEVVKDENGEKVLSVIVKNGDYAMNIDFSQVCKKRVALNAVLNKMVQSGDLNVFTLSETDVADLNAIIKEYEFEIACALCFVDSKRYRVGAWAESFCEGSDEKKNGKTVHKYGFNEMVRSLIPEGSNIKVDEFNFTNRDIKNQPKKNLLSEAKDSDLDFTLIDKIMAENDSKNAQHRYAKAIKENPEIRKILNSAEIISSIGLDAIRLESPKLYGLINGHQGTAKPKFAHDVVAYGNDILKASNFTAEAAKYVGGVRCQSFSDFMASMVVDYAQFVSELAAKKLTSHSYTKEPLFVKLFGLTGMKINMSLVPKAVDMTPEQQKQFAILKDKNANKKSKEYKEALAEYGKLSENAGLDENGNYIWEDESFPYDIAMEIVVDRRYSKNCGTIAVGISHNHIKKLLADDKISMVIPYHKSGLNHEVAMMRDIALYKDYTDVQNTRDRVTGKKLDKNKGQRDFDFYGDLYGKDGKEGTHDPKKTAQNYRDWCYENNYIPRFDEFMLDPNYYKLLIDFRVYDVDGTYTEQQPVQAIYPSNEEFKDLIINGVKDKNGKVYGGLKQQQQTSDRLDAESQQIIDEYKKRLKEKYGEDVLQHSDKEIIGESGTSYGMGVYLDSNLLTELTDDERIQKVKEYVKEIGGNAFSAYDKNGKAVSVHIAKATQKFVNKNGKQQYVNKDLTSYLKKEIKQESVVLIDELVANARYDTSQSAKYPHGWVDDYGKNDWEYWKVYIQEKNKTVWEATLDIATSTNGEKILYDIYPIEMVERSVTSDTTSTNDIIADSSQKSNEQTVNNDDLQHSDKDSDGDILTKEQIEFFKDSEARDAEGRLLKLYHGTPNGSFTEFRMGDGTHSSLMAAYGAGYYFDSVEASAKRYTKPVNKSGAATNPKVYKVYLNVTNPLKITDGVKTISKEQLAQIISRGNHQWFFTDGMPFYLRKRLGKSKEEIQNLPKEETINHWSKMVVERAYSDADILSEMVKAFKGDLILSAMKDVLGHDGAVYKDRYGEVWVAWDSNQIKSVDNTNPTPSNDIQYSDKDDDISVYEKMGEMESIVKENKMLGEDVIRLKEVIGTEEVANSRYLSLARYLKKISGSNIDSAKLGNMLKEAYTSMQKADALSWTDVVMNTHQIATSLMNSDLKVSVDYFKRAMLEIRNQKISLSAEQRARVEERFGSYQNFHKYVFGRINISNEGKPLTEVWGNWSKIYPSLFESDVNSAEQVDALIEAVDILKSTNTMMEEYERAEAVRHLSTEIYNQFWNIASETSSAEKAKSYKAEHKKMMDELRTGHEKRQKALVVHPTGETALKYESLLRKAKETKKREVAKAKEYGKQKMAEYKDNAERKTRIQRITKNALDLNEMLIKNSKDKHIPEVLKGPVINLLNAIDFSSKRLLDSNIPTQKDISLAKALSKVKDMMKDASNGDADLVELYGHGLDDKIKSMMESIDEMDRTIADNEFILQKMSLEDLMTLDNIVTTIKSSVSKMNKFHIVNHAKGVANLSQESMTEMDKLGKGKVYDRWRGKIDKTLMWNNTIPVYAFKRFGEGAIKVFEALQDGWDKFAFNVKTIMDHANETYTSKEVQDWEKEVKSFDILVPTTELDLLNPDYKPQYQKVQMTVPQIMSLYCLQKREQAKGHLIGGGIRVADFTVGKEVVSQSDGIVFTEKDIDTIIGSLTSRQIEVADKLQKFMNTVCSDWGNDVSMARFGYKAFGEENYFPIQSDKNNLAVDDETEKNNSLFRLLNMSFAKSLTPDANNRIVISNIFDVFAQHTSDMAKYNALALPVLDAFRWYNYTEKQEVGDTAFKSNGVKQSMERAFGKDGQSYFTTFLKDINGQKEVSRDTLGSEFFSKAKIVSVGANLRVVLLQPTSYVRASAVIDNKYLTKALAHKPKMKKAEEHCGIALWKSMGYYDTNVQKGVTEQIKHNETWKDKATNASMKLAGLADKLTWGYLWNACELEVRDKRQDLKVGSKEFYDAVSKRLREVIYATQVVDSTMTRSQMMRSSQFYDKMLTSFASEPTLAYNMVLDAFEGVSLDARKMGKKEAWKKNGKKIARVLYAYTMTNAVAALVESAFDAYRDDDDEEMDLAEFMKLYLSNFAQDMSLVGKIPYIKDMVSIFQGYGASRTDIAWMQSLYYATTGTWKIFTTDDGNPAKVIKNWIKTASYLSGLPFYNVYRDTKIEALITEWIEDYSD